MNEHVGYVGTYLPCHAAVEYMGFIKFCNCNVHEMVTIAMCGTSKNFSVISNQIFSRGLQSYRQLFRSNYRFKPFFWIGLQRWKSTCVDREWEKFACYICLNQHLYFIDIVLFGTHNLINLLKHLKFHYLIVNGRTLSLSLSLSSFFFLSVFSFSLFPPFPLSFSSPFLSIV